MIAKRRIMFIGIVMVVIISIFLWQPQQTLFFVFNAVTQIVPRIQLSAIPAPPEVIDTESALGPFLGETQFIRYQTTLTLEEAVLYYQEELPRQGWTLEITQDGRLSCINAERSSQKLTLQITEYNRGQTRIEISFTSPTGICNFPIR